MPERWSVFDHTADLGLEVEAETPERLFACAAVGLLAQVAEVPAGADETVEARVDVSGTDAEDLLVEWLNRALLEAELAGAIWTRADVAWSPGALGARLRGPRRDRGRMTFLREIKAVSHHALELDLTPGACRCRLVLDL